MAIAIDRKFFESLPKLGEVKSEKADIAWLVYDLEQSTASEVYNLVHHKTVYTEFAPALDAITRTEAGSIEDFIKVLQGKLKKLKAGEFVSDTTLDQALTE